MRFLAGVITGFLLSGAIAWASDLPSPPLVQDKEVKRYLKRLYDQAGRIEVVTTNPNGSRFGRKGDTVWWNDSGTYKLRVCTDAGQGGTTWVANS